MPDTRLTSESVAVPGYLSRTYWWAYLHPRAVHVFERQWLVNLILWGNFKRLSDAALNALGTRLTGLTLQVACVYGDLTNRLAERVGPDARLDVVDVLPIQLYNLARKLPLDAPVTLLHGDSARLTFPPPATTAHCCSSCCMSSPRPRVAPPSPRRCGW